MAGAAAEPEPAAPPKPETPRLVVDEAPAEPGTRLREKAGRLGLPFSFEAAGQLRIFANCTRDSVPRRGKTALKKACSPSRNSRRIPALPVTGGCRGIARLATFADQVDLMALLPSLWPRNSCPGFIAEMRHMSITAAGSSASSLQHIAPSGCSDFSRLRAFRTGRGHSRPDCIQGSLCNLCS